MDYITIPGRPVVGSRLETEEGFFEYDGKRWNKFPHQCKTQECADEPLKTTSVSWSAPDGHLNGFRGGEVTIKPIEGNANHDFVEDMTDAYSGGPYLHVGLSTGCYEMPETRVVRYLLEESTLEEWLQHFLSKQTDYGDRANDLGLAGQYAELSRKFIKLRRAMWDGHELTQESLREVLMDLIGHGFLSLMYVDHPGLTVYPKGQSE